MFKRISAFLSVLLLAAHVVSAASVTWSTTNWNVNVPLNKATTLSQVADTPYSDGTYIVTGSPVRYPNTNSGSWSANLYAGTYRLDIESFTFAKPFYFLVPAGSGTYNAAALRITNSTSVVIANLYDSFIQKTNGTGVSNTFSTPFISGATTLLDTVPIFYVGAGHLQTLSFHSSGLANMHWTGSLVIDGGISAASTVDATGLITAEQGLTVRGVLTLSTNSTPPVDTSTIKAWVNVTLPDGNLFKMPLYQ